MKARFIGNPDNDFDGPRTITVFGIEFAKDAWVNIEDPAVFARLSSNVHWEVKGQAPKADPVANLGDWDGDKKPGGDAAAKKGGRKAKEPDPEPEPVAAEAVAEVTE